LTRFQQVNISALNPCFGARHPICPRLLVAFRFQARLTRFTHSLNISALNTCFGDGRLLHYKSYTILIRLIANFSGNGLSGLAL
jgi:hypothetical protein